MRPPLSSLVSTAALLLALLGQGTALVHMGVARHERCAEHNEIVDVRGAGHARPADRDQHSSVAAVEGDGDGHGADDHCFIAFRAAVVPEVELVLDAVDVTTILARAVAGLGAADGVVPHEILDRAPKTSPPQA